jgi:hypothetical protein
MEVADQWDSDAHVRESAGYIRDGACRVIVINGDSNQSATRADELGNLEGGPSSVSGVGIGHRLHDDRVSRPNRHIPNEGSYGLSSRYTRHVFLRVMIFES